jgi:protein TonB
VSNEVQEAPMRTFTFVSVVIHGAVLGTVLLLQAFHVGPLPALHDALAFNDVTPVVIKDIPLAPPQRSAVHTDSVTSANAAPIEAPARITPETEHQNDVRPLGGVEGALPGGANSFPEIGGVSGATLPPPPPPAPKTGAPLRLHTGILPPQKIVDVAPVYPPLARASRQEGIVILETVITANGSVESVRVLKGYPLLDGAAIEAVRQWRFTPARLNGEPVPVVMTVTVNFTLK